MANYFFALDPGGPTKDRMGQCIDEFSRDRNLAGIRIPNDFLHMSVQSLGEYDQMSDRELERALLMGSRVEAPSFRVTLDRLTTFGGDTLVLVAAPPIDGIVSLRRGICAEMQLAGMPVGRNLSFSPHVTVWRDKGPTPDVKIDRISWIVRDFVLIRSSRGRHIHLGRWPLRG